jgi:hypothetical protein
MGPPVAQGKAKFMVEAKSKPMVQVNAESVEIKKQLMEAMREPEVKTEPLKDKTKPAQDKKNPQEVTTEPFPEYFELENIAGVDNSDHCMVHCRHKVCKAQVMFSKVRPGHGPAPVCKCMEKYKPGAPATPKTRPSTWKLKLDAKLIEDIDRVTKDHSTADIITIYEDELTIILTAIREYFVNTSTNFKDLRGWLASQLPTSGKSPGTIVHNLIDDGLVRYFWDTMTSHGETTRFQVRNVSIDTLIAELDIYQCALMADCMRKFYPRRINEKWIDLKEVRRASAKPRYAPMAIMWKYWASMVELLLKVLQWRDMEKRKAAEVI